MFVKKGGVIMKKIISVVLVLAVVGIGIYFIASHKSDEDKIVICCSQKEISLLQSTLTQIP